MDDIDPIYTEPEKEGGLLLAVVLASALVAGGMFFLLDYAGPRVAPASAPAVAADTLTEPTTHGSHSPIAYRCTVEGVTRYSETPCKGGTAVEASRRK